MITTTTVGVWIYEKMPQKYDYRAENGSVRVMRDPQVPTTFAARFLQDGESVDLLFVTGNEEGETDAILARTLEEVEFDTWPPMSGSLKFFW